jgi:hypothetical protein
MCANDQQMSPRRAPVNWGRRAGRALGSAKRCRCHGAAPHQLVCATKFGVSSLCVLIVLCRAAAAARNMWRQAGTVRPPTGGGAVGPAVVPRSLHRFESICAALKQWRHFCARIPPLSLLCRSATSASSQHNDSDNNHHGDQDRFRSARPPLRIPAERPLASPAPPPRQPADRPDWRKESSSSV